MKFDKWKELLLSAESTDRSEAADVLPDGGEEAEVIKLLLQALRDEDSLVRTSAAETLGYVTSSLGKMGHLADLKLLVDEALSQDVTAWGKLHCAQGIAILAVDYAVRSIIATIKDSDWKLGAPAFGHLESIADLLDSNVLSIVNVAREWEGKERSGIEREAIGKILSRTRRQPE